MKTANLITAFVNGDFTRPGLLAGGEYGAKKVILRRGNQSGIATVRLFQRYQTAPYILHSRQFKGVSGKEAILEMSLLTGMG